MKKNILITGSTKGIGLAITNYLTDLGYQVIGIARHKPSFQFPGVLYLADLSNREETHDIFNTIQQNHLIQGIINNVGIATPQLIEEIDLNDFEQVMDINLHPAIQAMKIFITDMKEKKMGPNNQYFESCYVGKNRTNEL